eukprot:Gb_35472 [translate_table: standard]
MITRMVINITIRLLVLPNHNMLLDMAMAAILLHMVGTVRTRSRIVILTKEPSSYIRVRTRLCSYITALTYPPIPWRSGGN